MVATAPGEKNLLIGRRRPVIKLVFVRKRTFVLRKINKNGCHQRCFLTPICTKSFVDWGFSPGPRPTGGAYSAHPDPLAVFRGLTSEGRGEEGKGKEERAEGGSSSFVLGRKRRNVGAYGPTQLDIQTRACPPVIT